MADADAHGAQGVASAGTLQLVQGGGNQSGAAHAQGMTQGDGSAVRINVVRIIRQTKVPKDRQALGGKGFVQLDDIHLVQGQAGNLQHFAGGRCRAHAHDARWHTGGGHGHDSCSWC